MASLPIPAGGGSAIGGYRRSLAPRKRAVLGSALVALLLGAIVWGPTAPARAAGDANQAQCLVSTEGSPGFRAYLPDCRAFEQVTPPYHQGHIFFLGPASVAPDGDSMTAGSLGAFGGSEDVPTGPLVTGGAFKFIRSEDGWGTLNLTPSATEFAKNEGNGPRLNSPTLDRTLFVLNRRGEPALAEDLYVRREDGSLTLLGPLISPQNLQEELEEKLSKAPPAVLAGSSDLTHVVFTAAFQRWPGDSTTPGSQTLYESSLAGGLEPKLVAIKNTGRIASNTDAELISQCGVVYRGSAAANEETPGLISEDGQVVPFTASECSISPGEPTVNELYARVDSEKTVPLSSPAHPLSQGNGPGPEECNAACEAATPRAGNFLTATADGTKIFFSTTQPLLNSDTDETADIYEAQLSGNGPAAHLSRLIQISKGGTGDPSPGAGALFLGLTGVSRDGSSVYFVAEGALTSVPNSLGETPVPAEPNLYVVKPESGETAFVAQLSREDGFDWECGCTSFKQVSASGRFLVFSSFRPLTPDDTSTGLWQLFRFDGQNGSIVRVSVGDEGFNNNGNTETDFPLLGEKRSVTDQGLVFFSTSSALTPVATSDPEHLLRNIYEFASGRVFLIAPGSTLNYLEATESATKLLGSDETGDNVFFLSGSPLVPTDTDTQVDLYDARVGGGFPGPMAQTDCGQTSSCQPATAPQQTGSVGGSAAFTEAPKKPKNKPRKKHKKQKHKKHPTHHGNAKPGQQKTRSGNHGEGR